MSGHRITEGAYHDSACSLLISYRPHSPSNPKSYLHPRLQVHDIKALYVDLKRNRPHTCAAAALVIALVIRSVWHRTSLRVLLATRCQPLQYSALPTWREVE